MRHLIRHPPTSSLPLERSTLATAWAWSRFVAFSMALGCFSAKQPLSEVQKAAKSVYSEESAQTSIAAKIAFRAGRFQELLVEFPQEHFLYADAMEALSLLALLVDDAEGIEIYREGKEIGRQCLRLNGAWVVMEDLAGGRITSQALRRLDELDLPCARGLLVHWVRWVETQGISGRIDLRAVGLLSDRVNELAGEALTWRDHWVMGMLAGLGAPSEENRNRAEIHFQEAMALAPGLATPAIDRLAAQIQQEIYSDVTREGLRQLGAGDYAVYPGSPWAVQNQRALKRAIELLAQLRDIKNE